MGMVSDIFDKALKLNEGERITIPFKSRGDLKSKVVLLIRERNKYNTNMKDSLLRKEVYIEQEVNTKKRVFKIHLSTTPPAMDWLKDAVIVDDTAGEVKPLFAEEDKKVESESERIKRLRERELEQNKQTA